MALWPWGAAIPEQSDLDVLVVTACPVPAGLRADVFHVLTECSLAPLPLEISLLVQSELQPWSHPAPFDLHYSEMYRSRVEAGQVPVPGTDLDLAAHLTVAHRHGITVLGTPIQQTLPVVPWADYVNSILADFDECVHRLPDSYAVLTMARVWATIVTGEVQSKESGGRWALEHLPPSLRDILERALSSYRYGGRPDFTLDRAMAEFRRYLATVVAAGLPG